MEQYLEANGIEAQIEKSGMPPLRLWLHNRRGDAWCLIRYADGVAKWGRESEIVSQADPSTSLTDRLLGAV
jgi:hypothetical protein